MSHRSSRIAMLVALAIAPAAAHADLSQNLVTPDARDAGRPHVVVQDFVTPDARDAGRHVVPVALAPANAQAASGFDFGDAAIGAGVATGLVLMLAGAGIAVTRRRGAPA